MESPAGLTVELDPHVPSVRDPVHGPCLANELWIGGGKQRKKKKRREKPLNKSRCLIVGKEGIQGIDG